MGGAISVEDGVVRVETATATGEGEIRQAEVGTVKHDDSVVM